ncbi:hypothetical protein EKG37_06410 [Robertmurraya yapensis]|uniref:Uncharacterized protein n=2 Tax=Bacillaceae TaxID=186817 RepID=A0A431WE77_9BACI|nr:hypothetical protein [Bacillus yapensis]RTR33850.1 hypothetical protein EKG37_06410 [Bacillus yapensis]TKS97168.1 hypothetical protein FAR12_06410 [Bacillus yapensis]
MMLWESYDKNEIYIIMMLLGAYLAVYIFPKKLSPPLMLLFLVWGFATSTIFDFTLGGGLFDYYKVNDSNKYELSDLLTYFLFATFSYFFVYFYKVLRIKNVKIIFYILGWTCIGLVMEKVSSFMGVTHYQSGYHIYYSVVVFLIVQTTTALYYELIKKKWPEANHVSHMD